MKPSYVTTWKLAERQLRCSICWRDSMSTRRLTSSINQYQTSCVTAPLG